MSIISIDLPDEKAAAAFGAKMAPLLQTSDIVCLEGPLGAGKTTLARGLIRKFCGVSEAPSPTFTLVETYENVIGALWHFDLYRLEKPADVWELGLEEALNDGICLIEWPDRINAILPDTALQLSLSIDSATARTLTISAPKSWRQRLRAAGIE